MPAGKIKKVVTLVIGMIFIVILANPFLRILHKKVSFEELISPNKSEPLWEMQDEKTISKEYSRKVIKAYKDKIVEKINEILKNEGASCKEVDIIEDYKSKEFGKINRVSVYMNELVSDRKKGYIYIQSNTISIDKTMSIDKKEGYEKVEKQEQIKRHLGSLLGINSERIILLYR